MKSFSSLLIFLSIILKIECNENLTNTTEAPFDALVGYASINVPSYSNGNDSYISDEYNYLHGIFMGIKWQCVEYARRWLFIRKGCIFSSIDGAADMWSQLDHVQRVIDGKCFHLKKYPNGSPSPPQNQSLLIYQRSDNDMPYGHVSVIVDILPNVIRVAEENYYPYYWSGNYSREIPYVWKNGSYFIEDQYPIFGWMVIEDQNQTQPLDPSTIDGIRKFNGTIPHDSCHNQAIQHPLIISKFILFFIFLMTTPF